MNNNNLLKCKNCGKEYNRQSSFDKHKLLCFANDSNLSTIINNQKHHSIHEAINLTKKPSTLIQTVEELVRCNHQLKNEIKELKKWTHQQKKKFIILDWLNKNFQPTNSYKTYINNLIITRSDLEVIFNLNLIDGVQKILENYINKNNDNIPLKAFDQKENKLYGYNDQQEWEIISSNKFEEISQIINKKIITEFKKWQDEHEGKLYTEEFSTIYLNNVKKVMGGNRSVDKTQKIIYKNLYKDLKQNLQNIIEYEFS